MTQSPLGWIGIVRLGLVQTALGSIVVLTTSTLNRVMVVELALPAILPGALVALHYAMQILRPRMGHGSDLGGRRTPWIVGGMAVLACGGTAAAVATAWMSVNPSAGIMLAVAGFVLIGLGVGAAGTTLLVLLAKRVHESRRAAAATIVWVMMILGFIVTAATAGHLLDPYSPERLVSVAATVSAAAILLTIVATWNIEGPPAPIANVLAPDSRGQVSPGQDSSGQDKANQISFRAALAQVWLEPQSRRFAVFVFISMLAYSAQDLILEPFAGSAFGYTPGESTKLSAIQHSGVLVGMILVALVSSTTLGRRLGSLRAWTIGGCLASAGALLALAAAGVVGPTWPLRESVFMLGVTNGIYAVAAIGSMMDLVGAGQRSREGVRMGLWGAAQAIAFGLGGFAGTLASDLARYLIGSPATAYVIVFASEAALFLVSAVLAARIGTLAGDPTARAHGAAHRVRTRDVPVAGAAGG